MFSGGVGWPPAATEVRERAGERDVVDVVAGRVRERAVLAPAGHPPVDQPRVAGEALVGTEPEPLGDAGPEALDERVGLLDQPQHALDAVGVLQVDADRSGDPRSTSRVGFARVRPLDRPRRGRPARRRRPCRTAACPRTARARCPASSTILTPVQRSHRVPTLRRSRERSGALPGAAAAAPAAAAGEPAAAEPARPDVDGGDDVSVPALVTVKPSIALENSSAVERADAKVPDRRVGRLAVETFERARPLLRGAEHDRVRQVLGEQVLLLGELRRGPSPTRR